ncbi:MAG: DUF2085 domain-containing protein [Oscillospiraceae bacterium]|nr:DUF2085 domain-containing protein [Oscillospiraceae bacterium]
MKDSLKAFGHKVLRILFWCHRRPERSFFIRGKQFPICARCTGIAAGYIIGITMAIVLGQLPWWIVLLCMIPLIADGFLQALGGIESTNPRRFVTGVLFGTALIAILRWIFSFYMLIGIRIALCFLQTVKAV